MAGDGLTRRGFRGRIVALNPACMRVNEALIMLTKARIFELLRKEHSFLASEYGVKRLGKPVELLTPAGLQAIRVNRVGRSIRESVEYV